MKRTAVVVLSGGQDSTTCLFWAKERYEELHALSFDYGQRHIAELTAAGRVAALAGVASHETVLLGDVLHGPSPLISKAPLETYPDFATMDGIIGNRIELTFVPMRNMLFLTIAANRAALLGADVITGICQEDNANYPDCRQEFAWAAEAAINRALGQLLSDDNRLHIVTPLMHLSKAESVRLAEMLPGCMDALAYSHTCYAGRVPPCGECHACVLRAHGFAEAGIEDPLIARTGHLTPA
jgi:7-cyano-7-deazaguanine synthase